MNLERAKLCMEYCAGVSDEQIKSDIAQGWAVMDYIQSDYDSGFHDASHRVGFAAGVIKAVKQIEDHFKVRSNLHPSQVEALCKEVLGIIPADGRNALWDLLFEVAERVDDKIGNGPRIAAIVNDILEKK